MQISSGILYKFLCEPGGFLQPKQKIVYLDDFYASVGNTWQIIVLLKQAVLKNNFLICFLFKLDFTPNSLIASCRK